MRALWEATNNRWNQWVLNYNQAKQLDLLRNMGVETPSWEDLVYVLAGLVFAAGAAGALWSAWERSRQDPWLRVLHSAQKRMIPLGLPNSAALAPRAMAAWVQTQDWGAQPQGEKLQAWLLRLEALRYGATPGKHSLGTLRSELRQLQWPPKP